MGRYSSFHLLNIQEKRGKYRGIIVVPKPVPKLSPMTPREKLLAHAQNLQPELIQVADGVYSAVGYSFSNSTMIRGESGLIIVDTHESRATAETVLKAYRSIDKRPVVAIIYTHSHRDHIGGAAIFAQKGNPEIIARPMRPGMGSKEIGRIAQLRNKKGLGIGLRKTERISLGIGPGQPAAKGIGNGALPPTYIVEDEEIEVEIDGVTIEMVSAPGESEDNMVVWLPEKEVLICGDSYYSGFPNFYSMWGDRPRDIVGWLETLEMLIEFDAAALIPGHTRPLMGKADIREILSNYRAAIEHVYTETVSGINKGLGPDQLIEAIELPSHLATLPYLEERYGSIAWGVRAIFSNYLGWFDGNPTHLFPLSPLEEGIRIANLVGGEDMLLAKLKNLLHVNNPKEWQWGLKLADYLIALGSFEEEAIDCKADLLLMLADEQGNALARNWFIYTARELRGEL